MLILHHILKQSSFRMIKTGSFIVGSIAITNKLFLQKDIILAPCMCTHEFLYVEGHDLLAFLNYCEGI